MNQPAAVSITVLLPTVDVTLKPNIDEAVCEKVVVPEGVREGVQGYQLRLETAPVLLCRFALLALSYEKLKETRKEKE